MPRTAGCSGVVGDNLDRCGRGAYGSFCSAHAEQGRWSQARTDILEDIEPHARGRLCIGMIKGNVRLCNNRVAAGPFNYCYLHWAQAPPTWKIPKSGSQPDIQIYDPLYEKLKERLLQYIIEAKVAWQQGSSHQSTPKPQKSYGSSTHSQYYRSSYNSQSSQSPPRSQPSSNGSYRFYSESQRSSSSSYSHSFPFGNGFRYQQSHQESFRQQREKEWKAEEEKRKQQERADSERRAREERQREEEARRRRTQRERRGGGHDSRFSSTGTSRSSRTRKQTPRAATDHYVSALETFNSGTRPSGTDTVDFSTFPWPVLIDHHYVKPDDVNEESVREFLTGLDKTLDNGARKKVMRSSTIAWHPDRFRARNLLTRVKDPLEREIVEEKAIMVSKIVNDIWHRLYK
ncbi:hypothetical protein PQX77_019995 [Marasmius sp. AFHP31]|nr:hypothetical protein PQX77_019995 [Marasmius sp. AFHP31]